jgi:hypothetical protein
MTSTRVSSLQNLNVQILPIQVVLSRVQVFGGFMLHIFFSFSVVLCFLYFVCVRLVHDDNTGTTMAKRKMTNNDLQNTTQKTKDRATRTSLKTGDDLHKG